MIHSSDQSFAPIVPGHVSCSSCHTSATQLKINRELKRCAVLISRREKELEDNKTRRRKEAKCCTARPAMTASERNIDDKILNPLRQDKLKLRSFLSKVRRIKQTRKIGDDSYKKLFVENILPQKNRRDSFLKLESEKQVIVSNRRATILEMTHHLELTSSDNEEENVLETTAHFSIGFRWQFIVLACSRSNVLYNTLRIFRGQMLQHELQFRSAALIQRSWRRSHYVLCVSAVAKNFVRSPLRSNSYKLFHARCKAADILLHFLASVTSNLYSKLRSSIRRFRFLQRMTRSYLQMLNYRTLFLRLVFDRAVQVLDQFVTYFHNKTRITSAMLSQMSRRNDPSVIRSMLTLEYFEYFSSVFHSRSSCEQAGITKLANLLSSGLRDHISIFLFNELKSLLIRLRRSHRCKDYTVEPELSISDAKAYIVEGNDPIRKRVTIIESTWNCIGGVRNKQCKKTPHQPILLLRMLTTEDITNSFLNLAVVWTRNTSFIANTTELRRATIMGEAVVAVRYEKVPTPPRAFRRSSSVFRSTDVGTESNNRQRRLVSRTTTMPWDIGRNFPPNTDVT